MIRTFTTTTALILTLGSAALAENFNVQMLNRGEAGTMVFEPANLRIATGDTVTFIAADRGHNAETVVGMLPEGAAEFAGKINEELVVTFDVDGFYGVKCKPHFAMGMVMMIAVGDAETPSDDLLTGRMPRKAKQRFEEQLAAF